MTVDPAAATGAAEVTDLGVVNAEPVVDVVHQLGDQKIQIGVPLAVGVRRHVDRHPSTLVWKSVPWSRLKPRMKY